MKLNVGAGNRHREGYLSVDIQGGDWQCLAWELPAEDESVDAIYSRHFIEHVSPRQAGDCLREWYRVLKPGGTCHIICPDRDHHIPFLGNHNPDPTTGTTYHRHAMHSLYGWQKTEWDFHKWAWTEAEMMELMAQVGFHSFTHHPDPDVNLEGIK
jgi:predicted SAM-dependent methyltransferase